MCVWNHTSPVEKFFANRVPMERGTTGMKGWAKRKMCLSARQLCAPRQEETRYGEINCLDKGSDNVSDLRWCHQVLELHARLGRPH